MPYHVYLEQTNDLQRLSYLDWYSIHNLKQAFAYVPEEKKANFLKEKFSIEPDTPVMSLNRMIERSIQMQREENEQKQHQAESNGHIHRHRLKV
jgi:hypothetical protein